MNVNKIMTGLFLWWCDLFLFQLDNYWWIILFRNCLSRFFSHAVYSISVEELVSKSSVCVCLCVSLDLFNQARVSYHGWTQDCPCYGLQTRANSSFTISYSDTVAQFWPNTTTCTHCRHPDRPQNYRFVFATAISQPFDSCGNSMNCWVFNCFVLWAWLTVTASWTRKTDATCISWSSVKSN